MPIEVLPAQGRFRTEEAGRDTWHSFSFGVHYDPHNVGFGALLAHNDDHLDASAGYPDHPHRDTEIVTWVIEGALRHRDDLGNEGVLEAGSVQLLSAGSGVIHTEYADGVPTRFVQSWLRPDTTGHTPSYVRAEVGPGLACVADDEGALPLHTRGASCHVATLTANEAVTLPDAPRLHIFTATGSALVGDRLLRPGDAARLIHEGGRSLRAETAGTSLLIWALA